MAYSDYGGYAYRNGVRVVERSDATITPEGDTFGTPGMWPGFGMIAAGVAQEDVEKRIAWPHGHAILGDGPIYVMLRKQWGSVHRGPSVAAFEFCWDHDAADQSQPQAHRFEVDGCVVEAVNTSEDNYYVYARLTQPDGTVWHGWSGYGVGAGLEDCGYGYSTPEREDKLWELFPFAVAAK